MHGGRYELTVLLSWLHRSAWAWECRGLYTEPKSIFQQWRNGTLDADAIRQWLEPNRLITAAGRSVGRMWVPADPPTDYDRFREELLPFHREIGETVQTMSQADALALPLPEYDFWVIDDALIVFPEYVDHTVCGVEMTTDPDQVAYYISCRDLARGWASDTPVVVP